MILATAVSCKTSCAESYEKNMKWKNQFNQLFLGQNEWKYKAETWQIVFQSSQSCQFCCLSPGYFVKQFANIPTFETDQGLTTMLSNVN
jgi:hypothetical protein